MCTLPKTQYDPFKALLSDTELCREYEGVYRVSAGEYGLSSSVRVHDNEEESYGDTPSNQVIYDIFVMAPSKYTALFFRSLHVSFVQ